MVIEIRKPSGGELFSGVAHSRKLNIPVFSGEDAYLWICRVEQYFLACPTKNDRDKHRAAIAALEGRALNWYVHWKQYTATALTWPSFKDAVVQRFQPEAAGNPFLVLLNIRQTGTVSEYRELFETLSCSEPILQLNVSDEILRAIFLNGLRKELRLDLILHKVDSDSIFDMMQKGHMIEERNRALGFGEDHGLKKSGPKACPLMKFWGEIARKRKVVMLVANGACNSQIAMALVKELGLPVCETGARFESFSGAVLKSKGLCRGLKIKVHEDVEMTHDFFVFDQLGGNVEIVLGRDWILKLGDPIEYGLTMEFEFGGKAITLEGDPSLTAPNEFRFSSMRRVY